jgi:3-methyladenine DNA glycosylase AlkD
MNQKQVLEKLKALANPEAVEGMAHYGINPDNTYGISIPALRELAKQIGVDHRLAEQLWKTGIHEARILAAFIADPKKLTEAQMEAWVQDFDSWDVCDQVCSNLFDRTRLAYQKAAEWSGREPEFVRRAGFTLMAALAVHDKAAKDSTFTPFFPLIVAAATDERNYVKKAVNWALRGLGKRNLALNERAIQTAQQIQKLDDRTARWIASDALRELTSDAVQVRLRTRQLNWSTDA